MNRSDFPILEKNSDLIYFDNGATTFKPQIVIDAITNYYTNYTANAHRGDYDNSIWVDKKYEETRLKIKKFINAKKEEEIIFTKGTTDSLNMIIFGFMKYYLNEGDEILLSKSEHASNILPWFELAKEKKLVIKYIKLDDDLTITRKNLLNSITSKTKVISLAHITNVVGDVRDIKMIGQVAKENNILFVVDAAQSIGHTKVDVDMCNIDFLAFSGHKMFGPTGIGVLYGKYDLLEKLVPICYGGGMNSYFESNGDADYKKLPEKLEAGTPNIAGVIGLSSAIDYINSIGIENINKYETDLKKYATQKLSKLDDIKIYNKDSLSGIIVFNVDNIFAQDLSVYLNHYNICIRSGNHCAKILKDELKINNTCRISFSLYNTKEEIDKLIDKLINKDNILDIILG